MAVFKTISKSYGRVGYRQEKVEVLAYDYGNEQYRYTMNYYDKPGTKKTPASRDQISVGGSSMKIHMGPDVGALGYFGSKTNQSSLFPAVKLLNDNSPVDWVAGHLLNADLGGSGTANRNLTALTNTANINHGTYENHIKTMLGECHSICNANKNYSTYLYGVYYEVIVSNILFAQTPSDTDYHSLAFSHITIKYNYFRIDKDVYLFHKGKNTIQNQIQNVPWGDDYYNVLSKVTKPKTSKNSNVVKGNLGGPMKFGPLNIHNTFN